MSFTQHKREAIKLYIMEKIANGSAGLAAAVAESFSISDSTVYRYLKEMETEGSICRDGKTYALTCTSKIYSFCRSEGELTDEDIVYDSIVAEEVENLPDNVFRIWKYAFSEMMNNAIDHSGAEHVQVEIRRSSLSMTIVIRDDGIGIFRNLQKHFGYRTPEEASLELFKGRLTTNPSKHSGEGIFFTSRTMDKFAVVSRGIVFSHDRFGVITHQFTDAELMAGWEEMEGTAVYMNLSNSSGRILKDVFDRYASVDDGFCRTSLPIRSMFDSYPVSRSQAKRLCRSIEVFSEVELDFDGVEEIGQGFAHELFVVFAQAHPHMEIYPVNANREVIRMIRHVAAGTGQ